MRITALATASIACLSLVATAHAEEKKERASPPGSASASLGTNKITINYSRPSAKGRVIFGGLVPWNEVWRTGANEATTITTAADVVIGGLKVPKGEYSLFTIPTEKQWTLVINKTPKQWGAYKYDAKQDLGRVPMTVTAAAKPVEQLTIELVPDGKQVSLKISWDKTVASVAIAPQ